MGNRAFRAAITAVFVLASAAITAPTAEAAPVASVVPSQSPAGWSMLRGVDCVTPTNCWAVGSVSGSPANRTLIERWDGTTWKVVPSPNADWARDSSLTAVSCVSPSDCMAVGDASTLSSHDLNAPIDPLFLHWDGATWTVAPGPRNGPQSQIYDQLVDVECLAADFCLAVGKRGERQTLAMRWNGTTWRKVATPNPDGYNTHNNEFSGVACTSRKHCFAVGRYITDRPSGNWQGLTLIEQWDGSRFRIVPSPNATFRFSSENILEGISCPATNVCIATGNFDDPNGPGQRTLALRWNGSTWKIVPSPTPPNNRDQATLSGVACTSAQRCFAAGPRGETYQRTIALARWNGTNWKLVGPPHLQVRVLTLSGVACAGSVCFAVGSQDRNGEDRKTLVIRYR